MTAGPTQEAIDPVRYISNHSSGKMGYALAESLAARGAIVTLVSGPVSIISNSSGIERRDVMTAEEMYTECVRLFPEMDGAILCAAVADYTVVNPSAKKIKKTESETLTLELVKTRDILAALGAMKKPGQVVAGFSLETHDEEKFAAEKLHKKNCDFIVLNSLRDSGAGFAGDTNKISILTRDGSILHYPLKTKTEAAADIVNFLEANYFSTDDEKA